jgi:fructosamine-3-kinase
MDAATAARLAVLLGRDVARATSLGGQHGVRHYRLELTDGRTAFAKVLTNRNGADTLAVADRAAAGPATTDMDPAGFAAEAAGLRWLAAAESVPVPSVIGCNATSLVLDWVDEGQPSPDAAARFGRELAGLHLAGAASFGAPWPGVIAGLPLPNDASDSWPGWFASNRVLPYARLARDAGTLSSADVALVEAACARVPDVAGPPEPPARIHGDCWAGNVLWSRSRGWLIDPAAHGGHRESDLAMLALFGAPYLDRIMAEYADVAPLAQGWRERVPLHQLHPLLVHVCLFGGSYRDAALSGARRVLAA